MKLLSVAIPCYNSEAYMEKCIESLLPGGEEVEILVVNDGSSDRTAEIADNFAAIIPNVNDNVAAKINSKPTLYIIGILPTFTPSSINFAKRRGIITSITTSNAVNIGVIREIFLYSLIDAASFFNINASFICKTIYYYIILFYITLTLTKC